MAAIVGIISRRGLTIEACRRNKPNKNKLGLYQFLHINSCLKQLYISNKMEHFGYKGGYNVTRIKVFKRRAGLGYILIISNMWLDFGKSTKLSH